MSAQWSTWLFDLFRSHIVVLLGLDQAGRVYVQTTVRTDDVMRGGSKLLGAFLNVLIW